jgi:protein-S-isoprenylcysteine O-methyltransferase Ste14
MLKTLSLIGYVGMLGGLIGLIVTHALFSASPVVISVQVIALLLFLWARITFGRRSYHVGANPTEGGLVTAGPYRFIRHPIYAALCVFTWAGIAAHWSWTSALFGALMLGFALLRITCEETLVAGRYPEYARYKTTTWRMIPFVY